VVVVVDLTVQAAVVQELLDKVTMEVVQITLPPLMQVVVVAELAELEVMLQGVRAVQAVQEQRPQLTLQQ
jgi:hypothetical protein